MNIFYIDKDPKLAAQMMCDKHVVKMILESAQLLCTAHHVNGGHIDPSKIPYKPTHINHPSAIWARENCAQYLWLWDHLKALCEEYTYRYGKVHKTSQHLDILYLPPFCKLQKLDPPPQCMPDEYKCDDTVLAYRKYYKYGKAHILKYTKRDMPLWLTIVGV